MNKVDNKEEIYQKLQKIGFTKSQTEVYLALLKLGRAEASKIAQVSGVSRTNCYNILQELITKGFIVETGHNPRKEYTAKDPSFIGTFLSSRQQEIVKTLDLFKTILPELTLLHNVKNRPRVTFFEGKNGLVDVCEDTLKADGEILAFVPFQSLAKTLPEYLPKYYKRRTANKIKIKAISPNDSESKKRQSLDNEELRETRIVKDFDFGIKTEIDIYNNKVLLISWEEKLSVMIESVDIADTLRKIFEFTWAHLEK
jgi:sugar-specific transcriptional regulator TrmB